MKTALVFEAEALVPKWAGGCLMDLFSNFSFGLMLIFFY